MRLVPRTLAGQLIALLLAGGYFAHDGVNSFLPIVGEMIWLSGRYLTPFFCAGNLGHYLERANGLAGNGLEQRSDRWHALSLLDNLLLSGTAVVKFAPVCHSMWRQPNSECH